MANTPSIGGGFTKDDVEILVRERGYDGFFKVDRLKLRHRKFDGGWSEQMPRELVVRRDAVGVLLYDPQLDAVALIEQFRVGVIEASAGKETSPWILELVAGLIDRDEAPVDVAKREAIEEANCDVLDVEPIFSLYTSPGGTNEYIHLFCGRCDLRNAGGVYGLPEEHEDIRVHVVTYDVAVALLTSGSLNNAITIIAMQWLQLHRERLRALWS